MGQASRVWHLRRFPRQPTRCSMSQPNDSNKSVIPLEQDNTMIAVIEMGQASWLVAGIVPGLERQPLKKLGSDEQALFQLLQRWRNEAVQTGRTIKRLVVAYEAGRDGFWLARWLRARDIEAYVIHPNSVAGIVTLMNDRRDKSCIQSRSCRGGDLAPCLHGRGSERPVRLC
jgi:hypothetical protein